MQSLASGKSHLLPAPGASWLPWDQEGKGGGSTSRAKDSLSRTEEAWRGCSGGICSGFMSPRDSTVRAGRTFLPGFLCPPWAWWTRGSWETWSNWFCSLNPPTLPSSPHPQGCPGPGVLRWGSYTPVCELSEGLLTAARHWSSWPRTPRPCPRRRSHRCSSPGIQPA